MERTPLPKLEYIKIPELKHGYLYRILARNATYGIWNSKTQGFIISRIKFGSNFVFEEYHWDCPAFATARPKEEIEKSPFEDIKLEKGRDSGGNWEYYNHDEKDILEYLNKFEGNRTDRH